MFRFANCVIVLSSVVTCAKVFAAKQNNPPHIVFVLADDLVSVFIYKKKKRSCSSSAQVKSF